VMAANLSSSVALTVLLFCLGYLLYPFLTLGAIWGFARKSEKKDFFYIFILTLFVSIVPNWAFGVSIVNESIATAWMLLSYIVFSQRPKLFLVSLFALLLFFTYELAITFYF